MLCMQKSSGQTLIIVESPTKARTLSRFLGSAYRIEASMGHIRDLPVKRLGVNVNDNFTPSYEIPKDKKDIVKKLQTAAEGASSVVLATDPDREGEAIAWHIAYVIKSKVKGKKSPVNDQHELQRIVFHQITKAAIDEAIKHPRTVDMNLVDAQQGRRVLDRLVGYKLSPLLWYKTGKNWLSAGRVQSIAVRLIVEREREIQAFVAEEYWEVFVLLKVANSLPAQVGKSQIANSTQTIQLFITQLVTIGEKKAEVANKNEADRVVSDLEKASYAVSSVKTQDVQRRPSPPFITSTLQRAASSKFGWSARKTMVIAQNLYEKGEITYHRTDSVHLSPEGIAMAREFIGKKYGQEYLPASANVYETKSKVAQEAHEAIRPTELKIPNSKFQAPNKSQISNLKSQTSVLGTDHDKLLELVTQRFVASQMKPQALKRTTVETEAKLNDTRHAELVSASTTSNTGTLKQVQGDNLSYTLRASGETEVFAGWRIVYEVNRKPQTANSKNENDTRSELQRLLEENMIPPVSEKDPLDLVKLFPEQKFTQPPARYNEASLIKMLEEQGIGRPSTYAPTLSTIQVRQYVEKNDNRAFVPTELGMIVNDFLVEKFGSVINVSFTADMEDKLDAIANGQVKWEDVIKSFWEPFETTLLETRKTVVKLEIPEKKTGEICPECGGELIERTGKFGQFIACNTFPACKFTKPIVTTLPIPCPKCGGSIVLKKTRKGRKFYGCSTYPACNFASWSKPVGPTAS